MTHEEKLVSVRAWIVKACPELLALTHGCIIEAKRSNHFRSIIRVVHEPYYYTCGSGGARHDLRNLSQRYRIVGHPIGICEVLRALNTLEEETVIIWCDGEFAQLKKYEEEQELTGIFWNLSDDNLDHQSPETISFLFSLIP